MLVRGTSSDSACVSGDSEKSINKLISGGGDIINIVRDYLCISHNDSPAQPTIIDNQIVYRVISGVEGLKQL